MGNLKIVGAALLIIVGVYLASKSFHISDSTADDLFFAAGLMMALVGFTVLII